jgi:hypothetical protein
MKDTKTITIPAEEAEEIAEDIYDAYVNTVVVDTAGRALDFLAADIIKNDPKKGYGGALTLQGYGVLKGRFTSWLANLKTMGKDVVLIAHSSEDKNGDDLIERLDVQGGSKGERYKSADAMGRLYLSKGNRTLSFSPTDTAFGKNPGNLDPLTVPQIESDPQFLGNVTHTIKDRLNKLTDAQMERQAAIAEWEALIDAAKTAEDYTGLVADVKKAPGGIVPVIKGLLHKRATAAGFTFDVKKKKYIKAEAA